MSLQDEIEYICPNGHYWAYSVADVYSTDVCGVCRQKYWVTHRIKDKTSLTDSSTKAAPKREIRKVTLPGHDQYSKTYPRLVPIYEPLPGPWEHREHVESNLAKMGSSSKAAEVEQRLKRVIDRGAETWEIGDVWQLLKDSLETIQSLRSREETGAIPKQLQ
jgi:hypothetical protein